MIGIRGKRRRTRGKISGKLRENLQVILRVQMIPVLILQRLHMHVLH
ncbi:hypothetical protein ABH917_001892 [Thermobifida halotolerans]